MKLRGSRLKALREAKNWSQGQLAYQAKTTTTQISRLEANQRPNASGAIVAEIARALETTSDYLYGLTDDPRPLPTAQASPIVSPDAIEAAYTIDQLDHLVREQVLGLIHTLGKQEEMRKEREE